MLQVELPVDRIHPPSIKFDTGVQNKATVTKNLSHTSAKTESENNRRAAQGTVTELHPAAH